MKNINLKNIYNSIQIILNNTALMDLNGLAFGHFLEHSICHHSELHKLTSFVFHG